MKRLLPLLCSCIAFYPLHAQISITSADMPVVNDTLRYSIANPVTSTINIADSGTNKTWNYSGLVPRVQAVDTYKTASSVNITYAVTIPSGSYGYKVGDSLPGLSGSGLPVTISDIYTFFEIKTGPSRYIADAFAAKVNSFPTPAKYTTPDVWYYFPLTYPHVQDSSNYVLNVSVPGLGNLKQKGYRKTRVDSWGTITTPYFTSPVSCIRVRSEIHEIDSITVTLLGTTIGFQRNFVDYKWLANGEHYPVLWATVNLTTNKVSGISYRDVARRGLDVANTSSAITSIKAYPNPAPNGIVNLDLPANWSNFSVELFDIQSRSVATFNNERVLHIQSLPAGSYIALISCGNQYGYVQIIK